MPLVHLGARNGYTACGTFVPDLPPGDRYWIPYPGEKPPGPVTCGYCTAGARAPGTAKQPRALRIIVVYQRPLDFPGEYVAREFFIDSRGERAGEIVARGPNLTACHLELEHHNAAHGLVRIPRHPTDDSTIVEAWL